MFNNISEGYHITSISNLASISQYGLTPRIGDRGKKVGEVDSLVCFTNKLSNVFIWMERFDFSNSNEKIIVLKLDLEGISNIPRIDNAGDYFTNELIEPERIQVLEAIIDNVKDIDINTIRKAFIGDKDNFNLQYENIQAYYLENKELLLQLELDKFKNKADNIIKELDEIAEVQPIAETDWDFNQTDPNLGELVNFIFGVSKCISSDTILQEKIKIIKSKIFPRILSCDLNITQDSALYITIFNLIDSCLNGNKPKYSNDDEEYIKKLINMNIYIRQIERYNRTGKRYSEEHKLGNGNLDYLNIISDEYHKKNTTNNFINNLEIETFELNTSYKSKIQKKR